MTGARYPSASAAIPCSARPTLVGAAAVNLQSASTDAHIIASQCVQPDLGLMAHDPSAILEANEEAVEQYIAGDLNELGVVPSMRKNPLGERLVEKQHNDDSGYQSDDEDSNKAIDGTSTTA
uniref:Uncharacterized protein n=1 Tax=Chlamydomonas euryale TaxID=1486919 RepID=A0A7R9V2W0_9CHLO|mmetsp:Transcript_14781/g.43451  ORF Transcript_14781/g.43451 Transcript_14781/m.43451 type:complete len:122 (+) Transcript_14781:30-395(+)|eukprot:359062-Chlamydomonas_euryale.AAC.12